jgi:hypothetical protein
LLSFAHFDGGKITIGSKWYVAKTLVITKP